jgi:long-subunit fatty acid transport protein
MRKDRISRICLLYIILLLSAPEQIHAGLFEQFAVSTKASSMGNAVTAYPPGAMAVHYNPAGLANIPGSRFDNALVYTNTYRRVKFSQADDPNTGKPWAPMGGFFNDGKDPYDGTSGRQSSGYMVIPIIDYDIPYLVGAAMGISHKPADPAFSRWTFGFGQYAPFAAGLKNSKGSQLSVLGRKAFFLRMVLAAPAVAYKLSDTVSIGASVGLGVSLFSFETYMRTPNDMSALTGVLGQSTEGLEIPVVSELTLPPPWFNGGMTPYARQGHLDLLVEDYFTTSYNLGILWEPFDWLAFGACYQSKSESTMEGDYKLEYGPEFRRTVDWLGRSPMTIITSAMFDLPQQSVPYQKGTATVSIPWPQRLQLGVKVKPVEKLTLTCDAHWTDWADWPAIVIDFDQKIQLLRFARMLGYQHSVKSLVVTNNLKNKWHFSYGLELQPTQKLAIRLGYEPRPTSVPDDRWGALPFSDMEIFGAGLSIEEDPKPKPRPKTIQELLHQIQKPNTVELSVNLIKLKDKTALNNTSKNLNSTTFTDIVYNPYAGLDVSQKMHIWAISLNQVFKW